ncbi:uncharacterized protein VTP21DRAFT_7882 [Calcarisporiella thermophila]|uniref:uncharacterized protein n=1 Tax=Calcarisporiella thermophila TaxID=911321 RepID=UPI0037439C77
MKKKVSSDPKPAKSTANSAPAVKLSSKKLVSAETIALTLESQTWNREKYEGHASIRGTPFLSAPNERIPLSTRSLSTLIYSPTDGESLTFRNRQGFHRTLDETYHEMWEKLSN